MPSSRGRSLSPRSLCVSGTRARSRRSSSLVFDAYQQVSPRAFNPDLPVRIIDIDEELLKEIGQWPWPRTVLADLVDKLEAGGAAAIGFDMVFPEPDRMSPSNALHLLAEVGCACEPQGGGREASVQRSGVRRCDRQGPGGARLHRRPARHLDPGDQDWLRPWRGRPRALRPLLPGRGCKPERASGPGKGCWLAQLDSGA